MAASNVIISGGCCVNAKLPVIHALPIIILITTPLARKEISESGTIILLLWSLVIVTRIAG